MGHKIIVMSLLYTYNDAGCCSERGYIIGMPLQAQNVTQVAVVKGALQSNIVMSFARCAVTDAYILS